MSTHKLSRREFLRHGLVASQGLVLGISFGPQIATAVEKDRASSAQTPLNAFVRIAPDNTVTVIVKHIEFGQGTFTGLPTVVADELDADWAQIRAEGAPADPETYGNLNWGGSQGTGGSSSMNNSFTQLRRAGATARAMLVAAAAEQWQVNPGEITVQRGVLRHAKSSRQASFGELAEAAAKQSLPKNVALKSPDEFIYIGRDRPRIDQAEKITGRAVYTQDFLLPGMLTAVVLHPPRFGGQVGKIESGQAESMPGVRKIVSLPSGVAVVADNFWAARLAREELKVEWDDSRASRVGTDELRTRFRTLATKPGLVATNRGAAERALDNATAVLESEYEFPYLAHASMEPMNCVARIRDGGCEMWYGVQSQSRDLKNVSQALGIPTDQITLNMLYAGGSFGRRAHGQSDFVVEGALIAQALDGIPVKLVWTREDDMRGGAYRPFSIHRLRGSVSGDGRIDAWDHRIVGQSILRDAGFNLPEDRIDKTLIEGAANLPYDIPNLHVDVHQPAAAVPVLWWRSVGHTQNAFSTEVFFDELAHAAGRDPLELRLALLADDPRRRTVLEMAAAAADWGTPLPAGRGRGIAVHYSFKTWVAEVAEVTVKDDDSFQVNRVTVAIDCGIAVNPNIVCAQVEGGVGYALSALLGGAVTLDDGIVQEDNFDTYPVLRMAQMSRVDVHIVESTEHPTGVGEPAVPPLAPAVVNAIFAVTGKRHRRLPLTRLV